MNTSYLSRLLVNFYSSHATHALREAIELTLNRSYILLLSIPIALGALLLNLTADAQNSIEVLVRLGLLVSVPLFWGVLYTAVASVRDPMTTVGEGMNSAVHRTPTYLLSYLLYKLLVWVPVLILVLSTLPLSSFLEPKTEITLSVDTLFRFGSVAPVPEVVTVSPFIVAPLSLAVAIGAFVAFFSHFYDLEALQYEASPPDSIRNSYASIRQNVHMTIGYFVVRLSLKSISSSALVLVPLVEILGVADGVHPVFLTIIFVIALTVNISLSAILGTYHVIFYEELKNAAYRS